MLKGFSPIAFSEISLGVIKEYVSVIFVTIIEVEKETWLHFRSFV